MKEVKIDLKDISRFPLYQHLPAYDAIGELITRAILEELDISHKELFETTCGRIVLNARSITGTIGLSKKALKYRIRGTLTIEAELIDDFPVDEEDWRKIKLRHESALNFHSEILDEYFKEVEDDDGS